LSEYWLAAAIGAGSGVALLALFVRLPHKVVAQQAFIVFAVMVWIYVGVRLANGALAEIAGEALFALVACGIAQLTMIRWPPSIGIAILLHGLYDAVVGPHTGVADWYPPLCAGFDAVAGLGLLVVLSRRSRAPSA
jgi:hypothetical protein